MTREEARQRIKSETEFLLKDLLQPAKKPVNGKASYVCPFCGHGTHGDGLTYNPKSSAGGLICFGCEWTGDVIDLYSRMYNLNFPDALSLLAQSLGLTIDTAPYLSHSERNSTDNIKHSPAVKNAQTGYTEAREAASYIEYYQKCADNVEKAASYLKKRGISLETARAYHIGYDESWQSPTALRKGKNPPKSPRVIIPITNQSYIARDTRDRLTESQKPFAKMNEGEIDIFNKEAVYRSETCIFITEGVFDALSIIEAGYPAISLNSVSNAGKLISLLENKPPEATIILCLDNDKAGTAATQKLRAELERLNISFIIANIAGDYKDANEALTSNKAQFCEAVETAARNTATRPDNTLYYINNLMYADLEKFKSGIKTGFENLDKKSGGLYAGLYILGAISSLGKTTFIAQMADQIAAMGTEVLYFSLEQSRLEMVSKSLARIAAKENINTLVTSMSIRRGNITAEVQKAASLYSKQIGERVSIIEGNFYCNVSFIQSYLSHYIEKTGSRPVVIIDYLQILQPDEGSKTTKEAIDHTVTSLKRISRAFNVPVVVISSLNRSNYLLPIDFESFKESGGIEYTADVVWGLQLKCLSSDPVFHTPSATLKDKRDTIKAAKAETPRKIEFVCLKNRYGISSFDCSFDYYPANDLFVSK